MSESERIKDMSSSFIGLIGFFITSIIAVIGMFKVFRFFSSAVSKEIEKIDTNKGTAQLYPYSSTSIRAYNYVPEYSSMKTKTSATKKYNVEISEESYKKAQEARSVQPKVVKKKEPQFYDFSEVKLINWAKNDAIKGSYRVLYSQTEKTQEFYNKFYKEFRKDRLENMAKNDALMVHNHKLQKKLEKLCPEGQKLSLPAEIRIYQEVFVQEMAALKDEHERMLEEKQNKLYEMYRTEASDHIDPEKFYQFF